MCSVQFGDGELVSLRGRLVFHARRLVRNSATAEDLVQETLLAVCANRAPMRGGATRATWAVAILKHKAADWWRSHESRWVTGLESGEDGDSGPLDALCRDCAQFGSCASLPVTPDDALERRELARSISRCTSLLPTMSAQVFVMHECLGFDTAEICERLDITPGNCRTLLHRARVALRHCLATDWEARDPNPVAPPSRSGTAMRPNRGRQVRPRHRPPPAIARTVATGGGPCLTSP